MGCCKSQQVVPTLRRRLTLGEIGEGTDEVETELNVTEEDRSLMLELSQQDIFDFVGTDGRKFSIGSETDKALHEAGAFSAKTVKLGGSVIDTNTEGIGFACKKGLKPEAPNQDSFLILKVDGKCALYGVFDGHGRKGHDVSNFVKDNLPKIIFSRKELDEDPMEALRQSFEKMQHLIEKATIMKKIDATRSGSTCSVVLHNLATNTLYIAHVGDSRVVLGQKRDDKWEAIDLTIDHKPDVPEERQRIEANGGQVVFDGGWNYRVIAKGKKDSRGKRYPGLNMSRAMGDLTGYHDAGLSASPDVKKHMLSVSPTSAAANKTDETTGVIPSQSTSDTPADISVVQLQPDADQFLLLCSDGVWEFIPSEVAVLEIAKHKASQASAAAEKLASKAWQQWIDKMDSQVVDDITVVLIHLGVDSSSN